MKFESKNESMKIPDKHSLDSLEGVPEQEIEETNKVAPVSFAEEEKSGDKNARAEGVRGEILARMPVENLAENPRSKAQHIVSGLKMFLNMFDIDKRDLSDDIASMERRVTDLNSVIGKLGEKEELYKRKLSELIGKINSLIEEAKENRIVKKSLFNLFSSDTKNREGVASLFRQLSRYLSENF